MMSPIPIFLQLRLVARSRVQAMTSCNGLKMALATGLTHVAVTLAAVHKNQGIVGVIHSGKLNFHFVRMFNDEGDYAWTSSLVSAVEECVNAGANVVNMSLGGGIFSVFERNAYTRILQQDDA